MSEHSELSALLEWAEEQGYTVRYESDDPNDGGCVRDAFREASLPVPQVAEIHDWIGSSELWAFCDKMGIPYVNEGEFAWTESEPIIVCYRTGEITGHVQYLPDRETPLTYKPLAIMGVIFAARYEPKP